MLRLNGYSTGAFGKWHETAAWETSVSGPFDRWPTHQGFDKFYGFIGGETDQWYPLIYDGVDQGRAAEDGELPLHRGHDQPGDQLGQGAAVDDARQAVHGVLRAGRDARAAPRAEGMGRQVQGPVRQGLGRGAEGNARAAEEAGRDSGRHAAGRAAEGPGRVGLAARGPAPPVRAPGRSVRRLPGAHRRRDRAVPAVTGRHRRARQHRVHLHRRRQRHQRRGRLCRHVQRDDLLQRRGREGGGSDPAHRQVGRSGNVPAHGRRLGRGVRYAVLLDQAGGVRLRRHAQRHGDPLAAGHQGARRPAQPVLARHRHRADDPRSGRPARAEERQRHACRRRSRAPVCSTRSTTQPRRSGTRRSTSRCSAIARSTTRAGSRARSIARPWQTTQPAAADDRRLGTLRREERLQPDEEPGGRAGARS